MTSTKFAKMLKDSKIIDKKTFTANDSDLIFTKVLQKHSSNPKLMNYSTFRHHCISEIATKKGKSDNDIIGILILCAGPVFNATKAEANRFHDDKTLYTGTHAKGGIDNKVKTDVIDRSDADIRGVNQKELSHQASVEKIQAIARGK